jgi:hypothetical protein
MILKLKFLWSSWMILKVKFWSRWMIFTVNILELVDGFEVKISV